jgi:hypothetical protein
MAAICALTAPPISSMSVIELAGAAADVSAVYFRRQCGGGPRLPGHAAGCAVYVPKYDDGELPPAPRVVHLQPRSTWK